MESYKDVLMSQPPAMYTLPAQQLQTSSISLENYKGILLCARPTNVPHGVSTQLRGSNGEYLTTATGAPAPTFIPGGGSNTQLGLGPSMEDRMLAERNHRIRLENTKNRRANTYAVVTRHKRWLRSFAEQMRKMKEEEVSREVEMARRAAFLRKQQAQKRVETVVQPRVQSEDVGSGGRDLEINEKSRVGVPGTDDEEKKGKGGRKGNKKKPKWALTEDEALEDEIAEADDLLKFAKNLDYDKYISDYEVAGALAVMRDRVKEIARENNWSKESMEQAVNECSESSVGYEEDEEGEDGEDEHKDSHIAQQKPKKLTSTTAARKAVSAHAAEHSKGWDNSTSIAGVLRSALMLDTIRLAERILLSSPSIQKIHNKFSLARVLQRCVVSGEDVTEAMQKPSIGGCKGLEREPVVVKMQPAATGLEPLAAGAGTGERRVLVDMQKAKDRTQGLPYLYRCPAI
ncbi:hypothetical protein ERJ75_000348600 [Trypanosoma vivax]|uniref:Uncharacterized protein n=1 Tax=Trypanosoma vivax (strain Y486) TaxID=1055687 RepID=G0TVE4_TRYVY|nr:hypothetical protein TRVL_00870 [Trypanosoma vivax]KAH8617669.1 hypothetical protein ERJ75_000348600 [Trypanosoma vivax]CCC47910.1 conserved hypothetical protein [Trypanosoma vivax Y486]